VYPPRPGRPGSPAGLGIFESSDKFMLEVAESLSDKESEELAESKDLGVREWERVKATFLEYGEEERSERLSDRFARLNSGAGVDDALVMGTVILALGTRTSSAISVVEGRWTWPNSSSWSVSVEGKGGGALGSES
jgi:hypothetical protein